MSWRSDIRISMELFKTMLGLPDNAFVVPTYNPETDTLDLHIHSDGPAFINGNPLTFDTPEGSVSRTVDLDLIIDPVQIETDISPSGMQQLAGEEMYRAMFGSLEEPPADHRDDPDDLRSGLDE
jgi:hypothetical protein